MDLQEVMDIAGPPRSYNPIYPGPSEGPIARPKIYLIDLSIRGVTSHMMAIAIEHPSYRDIPRNV